MDLANLSSVSAFAARYKEENGNKLSILLNNAGTKVPSPFPRSYSLISDSCCFPAAHPVICFLLQSACRITTNKMEMAWQVNYLGPQLLTELLLPALKVRTMLLLLLLLLLLLVLTLPALKAEEAGRVVHVTCDSGTELKSGGPWPFPAVEGAEIDFPTLKAGKIPEADIHIPGEELDDGSVLKARKTNL